MRSACKPSRWATSGNRPPSSKAPNNSNNRATSSSSNNSSKGSQRMADNNNKLLSLSTVGMNVPRITRQASTVSARPTSALIKLGDYTFEMDDQQNVRP